MLSCWHLRRAIKQPIELKYHVIVIIISYLLCFDTGNGTIEFPEFVNVFAMSNRGATRKTRAGQDGEMRAAFRVFDRDDDGFVTMRDLHGLLSRLGTTVTEEEAESMILAASGNDREKVSYEGKYLAIGRPTLWPNPLKILKIRLS